MACFTGPAVTQDYRDIPADSEGVFHVFGFNDYVMAAFHSWFPLIMIW